jgi:cell division protein FtsW (lipid II flippase)
MSPRNREIILLLLVTPSLFSGFLALQIEGKIKPDSALLYSFLLFLPFFLFHLYLRFFKKECDYFILPATFFLLSMGMIEIFRISPALGEKQIFSLYLSTFLCALLLHSLRKNKWLESYSYLLGLLGIILLLLLLFVGREVRGAKLWLRLGGFSFQPGEISKILLLVFLASYLSEKREVLARGGRLFWKVWLPHLRHLGPLILALSLSLLILIYLKDLGFSFLIFFIFLLLLYVSTARFLYLSFGTFLFLFSAFICYLNFAHVQTRIKIWLNPWQDFYGRGFQILQGYFGMISGGVFGTGIGKGFPNQIPAASTDFIFASIVEEMGILGGLALIIAFIVLVSRGFLIASKAGEGFTSLFSLGIILSFSLQALIILGGVTGILPLTGLTLPFVSYGGSSLLSSSLSLSLLLHFSVRSYES